MPRRLSFDAVADGGNLVAYAISEHIEYVGVHSGDATIQFPAQRLMRLLGGLRGLLGRLQKA